MVLYSIKSALVVMAEEYFGLIASVDTITTLSPLPANPNSTTLSNAAAMSSADPACSSDPTVQGSD